MIDPIEQKVLHALFRLSRDTRPISAASLGATVALTPTRVGSALVALEHRGLVDASRARLTMHGLAIAVQLGCASGGPRRKPSKITQPDRPSSVPPPLAARPEPDPEPETTAVFAPAHSAAPR